MIRNPGNGRCGNACSSGFEFFSVIVTSGDKASLLLSSIAATIAVGILEELGCTGLVVVGSRCSGGRGQRRYRSPVVSVPRPRLCSLDTPGTLGPRPASAFSVTTRHLSDRLGITKE
jgi:hypothetical protein